MQTRWGKRLSDITLEGATFRMSFLNHQTVRETPKKQLQRIYTVPDSLSRTPNFPGLSAEAFPDPWSSTPVGNQSLLQAAVPSQIRRPRSSSGVSRGHSVSTSQSTQLRPLTAPRMLSKDSKQEGTGDVGGPTADQRRRVPISEHSLRGHSMRTFSAPAGGRKVRGGQSPQPFPHGLSKPPTDVGKADVEGS